MRPVAPFLGDNQVVEAGVAPFAMFGYDSMAVGTSGYLLGEVAPDIDVILVGHGSDFFTYAGNDRIFDETLFGGGAGVRMRSQYLKELTLGAELFIEYEQRTGPFADQLILGHVGLPVAEQALENLWVYTDITLGLAIPLVDNRQRGGAPFFGFAEAPLGIAWKATDWLLVVAEGGVALPINGGYGSVGVAFRL